jgi:hypothetical protein
MADFGRGLRRVGGAPAFRNPPSAFRNPRLPHFMRTLFWDGINPYTGLPDTFDDPNNFFGDPEGFALDRGSRICPVR